MKDKRKIIGAVVGCLTAAVIVLYIAYGQICRNELKNLESDEVGSIRVTGYTCGPDGYYEYMLTDSEIDHFVKWINRVQLGSRVNEEMARSVGASSSYTILYKSGKELYINPGAYFRVNDKYYTFKNIDEMWDEFAEFNSGVK